MFERSDKISRFRPCSTSLSEIIYELSRKVKPQSEKLFVISLRERENNFVMMKIRKMSNKDNKTETEQQREKTEQHK